MLNVSRIAYLTVLLGMLGWGAGCGSQAPREEDLGQNVSPVELHGRASTYDFAFLPPPPLAVGESVEDLKDRLHKQSFPIQATGAVIVPIRDEAGQPITQFGSAARFTCGATLISPSYVVTAAHCVDSESVPTPSDTVVLEMYRPTRNLAIEDVWRPKTLFTGAYPDYQHVSFAESDGYFIDHYTCEVTARCGFGAYQCPSSQLASGGDVALLHCAGRPGDRYGYLDVAKAETPIGSEVFVPWKHEVYDISPTESTTSDKFVHYVKYPTLPNYADNYHYLDRNQLLPLMTIDWPDGTLRRKLTDPNALVVWTDALGCHGTSGSGFLQKNATFGAWELLGPTAVGGSTFGGLLCQHFPGVGGQGTPAPGEFGLGYSSLVQTLILLAATDWTSECLSQPAGFFTLGGRSACERSAAGLAFVARGAYSDFDPWRSPAVKLSAASTVGTVEIETGRSYRLAVSATPATGCVQQGTVLSCPELAVRVGSTEVLRRRLDASAGQVASSGSIFTANETGQAAITLDMAGTAFELDELTIVPSVQVNSFDTGYARREAALVVPETAPAAALPMRFAGDGVQGFTSVLYAGERLVLARQAVALRGTWSLRFESSQSQGLRCGLLARNGSILVGQPCSPGIANIFDYAGPIPPAALFIEGASSEGAELDDVSLAMDQLASFSSCENATRDGDETDVDCGGTCPACGDGKACSTPVDCASGNCAGGTCVPLSSCADGVKNGTESDIDCGGGCPLACAIGQACKQTSDCKSGACAGGICTCIPTTCAQQGKNCGTTSDGCGTMLTCGTCTPPNSCGGGGTANVCGCAAESDASFCSRLGKNCGTVTGTDNCGVTRTVSSCGTCTSPDICGGGGTSNVCGHSTTTACFAPYAQSNCLTYVAGMKVSANGHNWTCSNGNCANCAGFASCAPGGSGCPWGVVWSDNGACQ